MQIGQHFIIFSLSTGCFQTKVLQHRVTGTKTDGRSTQYSWQKNLFCLLFLNQLIKQKRIIFSNSIILDSNSLGHIFYSLRDQPNYFCDEKETLAVENHQVVNRIYNSTPCHLEHHLRTPSILCSSRNVRATSWRVLRVPVFLRLFLVPTGYTWGWFV